MSIFSPKLLAFYGVTTVGAIGLFIGVTNYGENHLKAAPLLVGTYQLDSSALIGCLKNKPLQLSIQQSGIYTSGLLESVEHSAQNLPTPKTEKASKPSLTGNWQNKQLTLTGQVTKIKECNAQMSIILKAELVDKTLKGTIDLSGEISPFTALRAIASPSPSSQH
jgi:hypothetical protein